MQSIMSDMSILVKGFLFVSTLKLEHLGIILTTTFNAVRISLRLHATDLGKLVIMSLLCMYIL